MNNIILYAYDMTSDILYNICILILHQQIFKSDQIKMEIKLIRKKHWIVKWYQMGSQKKCQQWIKIKNVNPYKYNFQNSILCLTIIGLIWRWKIIQHILVQTL